MVRPPLRLSPVHDAQGGVVTAHLGGAWCHDRHDRTGIVSNQNPGDGYDAAEPLSVLATCSREECIAKAIWEVAGSTNRRATYYDDAERHSPKAAS